MEAAHQQCPGAIFAPITNGRYIMGEVQRAFTIGLRVKFRKTSAVYTGIIIDLSPNMTFAKVLEESGHTWVISKKEIISILNE